MTWLRPPRALGQPTILTARIARVRRGPCSPHCPRPRCATASPAPATSAMASLTGERTRADCPSRARAPYVCMRPTSLGRAARLPPCVLRRAPLLSPELRAAVCAPRSHRSLQPSVAVATTAPLCSFYPASPRSPAHTAARPRPRPLLLLLLCRRRYSALSIAALAASPRPAPAGAHGPVPRRASHPPSPSPAAPPPRPPARHWPRRLAPPSMLRRPRPTLRASARSGAPAPDSPTRYAPLGHTHMGPHPTEC
nr:translation initiation factor IF-2-like [Aegilops tauschii subsp. strangulata]